MKLNPIDSVRLILETAGLDASDIQERFFPDEHWLIVYVPKESLTAAQSFAGTAESTLNEDRDSTDQIVLTFRPERIESDTEPAQRSGSGRLHEGRIDQLIQLLAARSRTSDALPSLSYVEDPRASLAAIAASRHQLIYGRRGVGKTALMLEAKRQAESDGHVTAWTNAHILRGLPPGQAFASIAESVFESILKHRGTSSAAVFASAEDVLKRIRSEKHSGEDFAYRLLPDINKILRNILRAGLIRLFIYVDDFYLMKLGSQPRLLDLCAGMLRDCDGWLKVASIERLTRPWEPSTRVGLELPHDASMVDLDVTLEDPSAAQRFLESVLGKYTSTVGIRGPASIAKPQARGRLVLASGGVPRDYLNLVASSIVVARAARSSAQEIGKEDVAQAAGQSARSKRRDLEQDVSSTASMNLISAQDRIVQEVRGAGYTYFRVSVGQKVLPAYEILGQLVDLRFAHLVHANLSDQHKAGVKYEVYVLDLSEFSDTRLKRGLNVLDFDAGGWSWRLTGKKGTVQSLSGTRFRDRLRLSPLLNLEDYADLAGDTETG